MVLHKTFTDDAREYAYGVIRHAGRFAVCRLHPWTGEPWAPLAWRSTEQAALNVARGMTRGYQAAYARANGVAP